jgi:hypothetical protein
MVLINNKTDRWQNCPRSKTLKITLTPCNDTNSTQKALKPLKAKTTFLPEALSH